MPYDFSNAPPVGQQQVLPNGAVVFWDGTKWANQSSPSVTTTFQNDVGRNQLHNGLFNVAQRGTGPWTTGVYTLDRWLNNFSLDTMSTSVVGLADADRTAIGDEAAIQAVQIVFAGTAGANALTIYQQNIEGVRRLGGKTVTVSFWARATTGMPKIGLSISQNFGSGGSPSPSTNTNIGVTAALTATWTRYSITGNVLSTTGKTLGTGGNDNTPLQLWLSCPSADTAWYPASGNLGQQSGTIQLWGVQLEIGSVATPLEKPDLQQDLAKCQRFFCAQIPAHAVTYATAASVYLGANVVLPVAMRGVPTVVFVSNMVGTVNCANPAAYYPSVSGFLAQSAAIAAGNTSFDGLFTASADL